MLALDLAEVGGWVPLRASSAHVALLAASETVDVRATGSGWEVRASGWVGAAVLGDPDGVAVDLRVMPKVSIGRLLFLLTYSSAREWSEDVVGAVDAVDVPSGVAEALVRLVDQALRQGVLQGYRHVEEAGLTIRGRVRTNVQTTRRFGAAIPVEVAYDDYSVDIAENQILRAALRRMLSVPGVPVLVRTRLLRQLQRLAEVSELRAGARLPAWTGSRLNARYEPALRLAEVILRSHSFELGRGRVPTVGFLLNMAKVFEDFVVGALGSALVERYGGRAAAQDPWVLDAGGLVAMRPDLVWYPDSGGPGLVVDAKYKVDVVPKCGCLSVVGVLHRPGVEPGASGLCARGWGGSGVRDRRGWGAGGCSCT